MQNDRVSLAERNGDATVARPFMIHELRVYYNVYLGKNQGGTVHKHTAPRSFLFHLQNQISVRLQQDLLLGTCRTARHQDLTAVRQLCH